jgi:RNA polymerase sigma factor (sigma-70 family)
VKVTTAVKGSALPEEFDQIFHEHYRFVYRTAYRVTGSAADAEDVLQTVFLKLLRSTSLAAFHENPKAYLYRTAVNLSLDLIRNRKRHESAETLPNTSPPEISAGGERLRVAMSQISSKLSEILILRHVHGYTDVEISRFLGTSRATVAVSLFRARARIRKLMSIHSNEQLHRRHRRIRDSRCSSGFVPGCRRDTGA